MSPAARASREQVELPDDLTIGGLAARRGRGRRTTRRGRLVESIQLLPIPQREAIVLCFEGFSYARGGRGARHLDQRGDAALPAREDGAQDDHGEARMTGADLDELAALWQDEPTAEEEARIPRRSPTRRRGGRSSSNMPSMASALLLLRRGADRRWSWRRRRRRSRSAWSASARSAGRRGSAICSRQIALMVATSDRRRARRPGDRSGPRANLRRSTIGLVPVRCRACCWAALLTHSFNRDRRPRRASCEVLLRGALHWPEGPIAVASAGRARAPS